MNDQLKIRIVGTLNIGSTIGEINTAIKGIEKKVNKLKINVQMDERISKSLSDLSKAMENHKKIAQDLNRVVKEEKTVTKEADGTIKEKIRQHLKSGEIIDREIKKTNQQTKATQQQAQETSKLIDQVNKLGEAQKKVTKQNAQGNFSGGSVNYGDRFKNTTYNYDQNNQVTSQRTVENLRQQELAIERVRQKLNQLNNAGIVTNSSLSRLSNAINGAQTEKELNRISQALSRVDNNSKAREKTKELEHQLKLYQQQAKINVQNLQRRYGSSLSENDTRALNTYLQVVNRLTTQTPNLNRQMQQLAMNYREVGANVRAATSHVVSFGQQLAIAMQRIPLWSIGMSSYYLPLNGLKDALQQIIEIDSQLTVLERVSNGQIDINQTLQDSINLASELGNKIQQVNEGFIAFSRQGFRGQDLTLMAEYATLLGNISDMSVEDSASTITAAVKGLNLEIEDSLHVINALNEVDNNFAIVFVA
ncbi:phage tail tape measure protein [Cytobacillus gottheilii]|uniref:phage tail tape measure protein n=1 Tax=Cytobacillus gottheilii TaxID=859144 RepID=UPI0009BAAE66|nr:phage tail tape measure protein [Cytobacillus gottheilii]